MLNTCSNNNREPLVFVEPVLSPRIPNFSPTSFIPLFFLPNPSRLVAQVRSTDSGHLYLTLRYKPLVLSLRDPLGDEAPLIPWSGPLSALPKLKMSSATPEVTTPKVEKKPIKFSNLLRTFQYPTLSPSRRPWYGL